MLKLEGGQTEVLSLVVMWISAQRWARWHNNVV